MEPANQNVRLQQNMGSRSSYLPSLGNYIITMHAKSKPIQIVQCKCGVCAFRKYRTFIIKGPWAVHLTLGSNKEMGQHSRYCIFLLLSACACTHISTGRKPALNSEVCLTERCAEQKYLHPRLARKHADIEIKDHLRS